MSGASLSQVAGGSLRRIALDPSILSWPASHEGRSAVGWFAASVVEAGVAVSRCGICDN